MNVIKLLLAICSLIFLDACVHKAGVVGNFCNREEFLHDLTSYRKADLDKLIRVLESSNANAREGGCRAALLARAYYAAGSMSDASDYFSKAAEHIPEFHDYFMLAKADAEVRRFNFDQARRITDAVMAHTGVPNNFAMRIRTILADIAVLEKNDRKIINTHEQLLNNGYGESDAILFNLASALMNVGEYDKANSVYKRLLINFPSGPGAESALKLKHLAAYQLNAKEVERRIDRLIAALKFDEAVADVDELLKSTKNSDDAAQLNSLAVKALMYNNKFASGVERSKREAEKPHAPAKALESYAWSLAKVGRYIDAADAYGKFHDRAANKEDKARACFFRGFSLYEGSLYSMALFSWASCHQSVKDSTYYELYLWNQALAFMLTENYRKAIDFLDDVTKRFKKSNQQEKYTFFLGYAHKQLQRNQRANTILHSLAQKSTPSYYVLLAREYLKLPYPKGVTLPHDALLGQASSTENQDCLDARTLYKLGFKSESRERVLQSNSLEREKLSMLQYTGNFHDVWKRSYLLGPKFFIKKNSVNANPFVRASHPLPHLPFVTQVSKKYNVDKSLLYAIIQEESGFKEDAVSYRGAVGLMQIMPFVGADLASRLSIDEFSSEQLKRPAIAIELGALLVATLKRQFASPHLVLAAYNAGPHQVEKWLHSFGQLPIELFVERIPFKQTRDYIKKVIPNESLYHSLDGNHLRLAL